MKLNQKKFLLELSGVTLVILALIQSALFLTSNSEKTDEVLFGYLSSFAIFMSGFMTINWASKKSLKTFLAFVLGGMFLRFILIGFAIFLFMRFTRIDIIYFIVSFFVFYLICQFYEIRFINLKLSKGRKWLTFSRGTT